MDCGITLTTGDEMKDLTKPSNRPFPSPWLAALLANRKRPVLNMAFRYYTLFLSTGKPIYRQRAVELREKAGRG